MANKPIGSIGLTDYMICAGRLYTDLTNIIALHATTSATANNKSTFRKIGSGSGAGYAVTGGKTLAISSGRFNPASTSDTQVSIAQSDNDVGEGGSSTSLTNPIFFGTESSTSIPFAEFTVVNSLFEIYFHAGKVASTKFCSIASNNGMHSVIFGYET